MLAAMTAVTIAFGYAVCTESRCRQIGLPRARLFRRDAIVNTTSSSNVRVSSEQFLELAEKSQLVPADAVRRVRAGLRDSLTGRIAEDPQQVAAACIDGGLLTTWQAGMLLRGKHKGFQLGKYRLLDEIGSGGMSRVYLAEHVLMRRRVAIKVLPPARVDDSSYLARFRREAEAIAQLDHPNIVRAFDIDQEGNTHYFVMEYIEGKDFLQLVKQEGPVEYRQAAEYIVQVADALHHAHQAGLIHRDIKPGNCLVERGGTVKLLDLGLAKFAQDTRPSLTLMHEENVLGTADYLAPEQARNSHNVDHRADIYSLGCTFYFLLTGHAPFPTGSLSERLMKHQRAEPADIRLDRPDVPQPLVDICTHMMQKSAEKRYQDAGEVAKDLRDWLEGKFTEKQEGTAGPFGDVWRRAERPRSNSKAESKKGSTPAAGPAAAQRPGASRNGRSKQAVPAKPLKQKPSAKRRAASAAGKGAATDPPQATSTKSSVVLDDNGPARVPDDVPLLPNLTEIDIDLVEESEWDTGSRYLPRRSTASQSQSVWIWLFVSLGLVLVLVLFLVLSAG